MVRLCDEIAKNKSPMPLVSIAAPRDFVRLGPLSNVEKAIDWDLVRLEGYIVRGEGFALI